MKKSILVYGSLMVVSFLVSCNSNKDDEVSFAFDGQYCTLDNIEKGYQKGQKVELKLLADDGYNLPDDIALDFGNNRGVKGKDYDYKIETEGDKKYAKLSFTASDDIALGAAVKEAHNPLTFTCETDNSDLRIATGYGSESPIITDRKLSYSLDGKNWTNIVINEPLEKEKFVYTDICSNLKKGQKIYFRGDNPNGFNCIDYHKDLCLFTTSSEENKFSVSGNVLSLLSDDYTAHSVLSKPGCLAMIFAGYKEKQFGINLVNANELLLPSNDLSENCYYGMFSGNTTLISAPYLPAKKLSNFSYITMFGGCSSLYVSDKPGSDKIEIFTCPFYKTHSEGSEPCPVANMFKNCPGDYDKNEDPLPYVTYYYKQES